MDLIWPRRNPSNETARMMVVGFANSLAARYSPIVGCTRSWDSPPGLDYFWVIMDNMMNLEVLLVAAQLTSNSTLRDMAISHADKTIANHIRADGSSFHLVTYSQSTGLLLDQGTAQGYARNRYVPYSVLTIFRLTNLCSTWSRGQAWGIHGFANSAYAAS